MRKIILSAMVILWTVAVSAQQTDSIKKATKEHYLQLSRSQRTGAFILLGVGVALIAVAAPGDVTFDVLPILAAVSAGAIIGSIPLFIASIRNKKKAKKISAYLEIQKMPAMAQAGVSLRTLPALSIKFSF